MPLHHCVIQPRPRKLIKTWPSRVSILAFRRPGQPYDPVVKGTR